MQGNTIYLDKKCFISYIIIKRRKHWNQTWNNLCLENTVGERPGRREIDIRLARVVIIRVFQTLSPWTTAEKVKVEIERSAVQHRWYVNECKKLCVSFHTWWCWHAFLRPRFQLMMTLQVSMMPDIQRGKRVWNSSELYKVKEFQFKFN